MLSRINCHGSPPPLTMKIPLPRKRGRGNCSTFVLPPLLTRGFITRSSERGQVTRCSRQVPSSIMGAKIM